MIAEKDSMTGYNIVHNISQKLESFSNVTLFLNRTILPTPHTPSLPPLLLIHLCSGSHAACGPLAAAAAAAVCVSTYIEKAGETHHDRQITMLQHHTNWPGAYRESLVFSSLVFWDVRAEGGRWGRWGGWVEARSVSFDYGVVR